MLQIRNQKDRPRGGMQGSKDEPAWVIKSGGNQGMVRSEEKKKELRKNKSGGELGK